MKESIKFQKFVAPAKNNKNYCYKRGAELAGDEVRRTSVMNMESAPAAAAKFE